MISCPECPDAPTASLFVAHNCYRCDKCGKPVFVVHDPFQMDATYPAISNVETLEVPDDILLHKIIDQSPVGDPPRNMVIEFDDGDACLIVQSKTKESGKAEYSRKSLEKTAVAIKHHVLAVRLPVELMDRIRAASDDQNGG